ncbi:hypothetical protein UlMin_008465 [Ulmus minor]
MILIKMISSVLLLLVCCSSLFVTYSRGQEEFEPSSMEAPMEKEEQEALYSTIQGFVGKWWNGSDLYPDPCGWTPIQGVYCDLYDALWYVSVINIGPIYDNSLRCSPNAEFSQHLFKLNHLKELSLFKCFTSPHKNPLRITNLKWEIFSNSLETLEFRSNPGLIGTIPTNIGYLRKLQSLVLLGNGLSGELPMEIGFLGRLKKLVLAENHFVGQIPSSVGNLSQLLIFDCSRNSLSGSLPLSFGSLSSLLKLDLSNNKLEGKLPKEIGKLKNLTLLDLGRNNFSGGLSQSLEEMDSLKDFVISNNPIGGDLKGIQWKKLKNLEVLDLSNTSLGGIIPESMVELRSLRFLGLESNNLSGMIPPRLATMPGISTIYLGGNNLRGEIGFPKGFFRKMGGRFGAWNNPNLCYDIDEVTSKSYAPKGIKPCDKLENNMKININSHVVESLGFSRCGFDELFHVFVLQGSFVFLFWNVILL